jgi:hypothetical protein
MRHATIRSLSLWVVFPLVVFLTGCVSAKYKLLPEKSRTPQTSTTLASDNPQLSAAISALIVFKGPGSWKREAYWDEYVVTVKQQGKSPVILQSATIEDALGTQVPSGSDPWLLEKASKTQLDWYSKVGLKVVLGLGITSAWVASLALAESGLFVSTGAATAGVISVVAIPVTVGGHFYLSHQAKKGIETEFQKRRLVFPLTLAEGAERHGSLFFPVCPGPKSLSLAYTVDGVPAQLAIDLKPLAGLHLEAKSAGK